MTIVGHLQKRLEVMTFTCLPRESLQRTHDVALSQVQKTDVMSNIGRKFTL